MARVVHVDGEFYAMTVLGFVVVGTWFSFLPDHERQAVIAHELGHIAHNHMLKRWWWIASGQWRDLEERCRTQELEADAYAARTGHALGLMRFLSRTKGRESEWHPDYHTRVLHIQETIGDSPCL